MPNTKLGIITGASSGIGAATAAALAKRGHRLYCTARKSHSLQFLKTLGIETVELDLSSTESITGFIKHMHDHEPRIDFLINNAGIGCYSILEEAPLRLAREQFEVNVFGPLAVTQGLLPLLRSSNESRLINISSAASIVPIPLAGLYCASKRALEALTEVLRLELRQFKIKVILVRPSAVLTRFGQSALQSLLSAHKMHIYRMFFDYWVDIIRSRIITGRGALGR